jgi:hypothetical protein
VIISILSGFGIGAAVASFIAWLLLKNYLPSYLSEKGKNLATKEDIALITREVEEVRHEYTTLVEELRARQQLRMAAVDRRLQAHQEAFTHWRSLFSNPLEAGSNVATCEAWWEKNCLYLEPSVRQAFVVAYSNAHMRDEFVRIRAEAKLITEAWGKVMAFPDILFNAVQLPPLTEAEIKALQQEPPARRPAVGANN